MKLKDFFCQFPNPWTPRVSRMGCYTSKCEKNPKPLHPIGQPAVQGLSRQSPERRSTPKFPLFFSYPVSRAYKHQILPFSYLLQDIEPICGSHFPSFFHILPLQKYKDWFSTKGDQTKLLKFFRLKIFSICHRANLELRISPRIFEKIRNGLNGILWGWGETDSWKEPEAKNLVTLSL